MNLCVFSLARSRRVLTPNGFRVWGLGFRVWGFRVWGLEFRV